MNFYYVQKETNFFLFQSTYFALKGLFSFSKKLKRKIKISYKRIIIRDTFHKRKSHLSTNKKKKSTIAIAKKREEEKTTI